MRMLLLFLSLTVALGMPTFPSDVEQKPVAAEQNPPPVGDWVPVQGHVVVEHPAPQVSLTPKEQQQQSAAEEHNQKEDETELEDEEKPEVKDLKADPEAEVEEELIAEQEPAPEAPVEDEAEAEPGAEPDLMEDPDFKVESEVKVEVEGQPQDELEEEEEDLLDPNFKVQSEVRVDADVGMEADPEEAHVLHEAPEKFQARLEVDREIDPGMEVEERHIDMEGKLQPSMESELLDDDVIAEEVSHTELSAEEMAFGDASQQQDAAAERLPEEEEEEEEEDKVDGEEDLRLMGKKKENGASDEQEIMELEPEMTGEQNPEDVPDPAVLDEEPLNAAQQQQTMRLTENYIPEEETGMETYLRDERAPEQFSEEPARQEKGLPMMMEDDAYRGHYCPGMITGGKCYQFFRGPKKYEAAEFFCQEHFSGGHLASITSQRVHQELMRLIQQRGGYTRTWVGGRRIDSHLFIWLDGSRWSYDDWLPGEPNNTANVENCLEVLGNGKFNDFTCWEPQAFVCSYPPQ